MQCWYCLKETRFALVGARVVCFICIGDNVSHASSDFRGKCICCGEEIGKRKGLLGQKTLSATLIKDNDALCSACYALANETREKALLEHGSIPENEEFSSTESFPGPLPFSIRWRVDELR